MMNMIIVFVVESCLDDKHISKRLYIAISVISSHAGKLNVMLGITCKVSDY